MKNMKDPVDQPACWIGFFDILREKISQMRDKSLAEQLLAQCGHAIEANDINQLKALVRQLLDLVERTDSDVDSLSEQIKRR